MPGRKSLTLIVMLISMGQIGFQEQSQREGSPSSIRISGSGATFPNPLLQKWFSIYHETHSDANFDYASIGSGGGIKQMTSATVDFAATDAPLNDEQLREAQREILHIPITLGAVVVTYNVPGLSTELRLSSNSLSGIYLGSIKRWNDQSLVRDNPGATLPDADIVVTHRADATATTYAFTDYLSKANQEWMEKCGAGIAINWPVGLGSKGSEGVSASVKKYPNSIGYVELIYALLNDLPCASLQNASGNFVRPSLTTVTDAAAGAAYQMSEDLRAPSVTNAPGFDAYPISTLTYVLVDKVQKKRAKGKLLVDLLWWAIHEGQQNAPELHYAPLPPAIVQKGEQQIKVITDKSGQPLFVQGAN